MVQIENCWRAPDASAGPARGVFPGMRAVPVFILLRAIAAAGAWSQDVHLDSSLEWGHSFEVRCAFKEPGLQVTACAGADMLSSEASVVFPAFGLELPWLAAGWLRPQGLMRVVSNPLGFSASSPVWGEQPGFCLDASQADPVRPGIRGLQCRPGSTDLGFFNVVLASGSRQGGGFAAWAGLPWLRMEGLWSITSPAPESLSQDWFFAVPPWPGGELLDLAARLAFSEPGASISTALGVSSAESSLPGMFWSLHGSASWRQGDIDLLASKADLSYRAPDGSCPSDLCLVSVHADMEEGRYRLEAGFDSATGRPGFSPGAVIPSRETLHLKMERSWTRGRQCVVGWSALIDKCIRWDACGLRAESSRCLLDARASLAALQFSAGLKASTSGGFEESLEVGLAARLRPRPRMRISLEGGIQGFCAGNPAMTLLCSAALGLENCAFSLEAGLEGWHLESEALRDRVRLRISWSSSSRNARADDLKGRGSP
jgi:hypothetical protein